MFCSVESMAARAHPSPIFHSSSACRNLTIFGVITAVTFSACSSAPTPLYRLYQDHLGLTPPVLTTIFGAYAFSLLAALLTVGSLSDYIGRKPVTFAALLLNAVAMAVFANAHSALDLIGARIIQGFAMGAAITTLGAAILDADRGRGPLLNSITAFIGLMIGAFGAAALATYAPAPESLVYALLLAVTLVLAIVLWFVPETAEKRSGAWASLRPHLHVPPKARHMFILLTPINIAAWALGGFYLSLMPSLVRVATGISLPIVGGSVVATLMASAAVAVIVFRKQTPVLALRIGILSLAMGVAITLAGVHAESVVLLMSGTLVAGFGFGTSFSGIMRTLLPLADEHERAGLLSVFYVESYLAFSLPTIAIGLLVPVLSLPLSAYVYGSIVLTLALISFVSMIGRRNMDADA
jgi:MFS family permease